MKQSRYSEIVNEFEVLLSYGKEVSTRLVGTTPTKKHHSYADAIYTKLLCHAISLQKLSPQTENKPDQELWDLPSACAIARCLIEAHDVLGYMVFAKVSEDERDFRILLWQLHDQQRRSKMLNFMKSTDQRVNEIHLSAETLNSEVQSHQCFQKLQKNLQKKIKSLDAPSYMLSQKEINAANSVNHEYYNSATMWLSQYVHTLPMSVHQLNEFCAGTPEALNLCSMPIQYTLGFLAISITKMAEAFPQASFEVKEEDAGVFSRWSTVIERGVTT